MRLRPLSILITAATVFAACAPLVSPAPRAAAKPAAPAGAVLERSGLPPAAPTERPKRTGLHPGLFEDLDTARAALTPLPTPTATPTAEIADELPVAAYVPPRSESLGPLIASAAAPNIAAALRLVEQGRQQLDNRNYETALDVLERAVAIDPANVHGYYYLAAVHFERESYSQAIAFANRAAVLADRGDAAWAGRTHALQGAVFEKVGRYADARSAYSRAVEIDPGNVGARVGLARLGGAAAEAAPRSP